MTAQWRQLQVINFSKECCLNATRRRHAIVVRFSTSRVAPLRSARRLLPIVSSSKLASQL
jgi:hypothetical protein